MVYNVIIFVGYRLLILKYLIKLFMWGSLYYKKVNIGFYIKINK